MKLFVRARVIFFPPTFRRKIVPVARDPGKKSRVLFPDTFRRKILLAGFEENDVLLFFLIFFFFARARVGGKIFLVARLENQVVILCHVVWKTSRWVRFEKNDGARVIFFHVT